MRSLPENQLHPALKSLRHEEAHLKTKLQKIAPFAFPSVSNTGVQVLCDILVTNVIIPGINLATDKEMGYRIVIEANSSLRKKFRKELVKLGLDENANEIPPIWKRRKSNANKIILYDFGSRGFVKTEKSIFVLSVRQILEDHQMFYSFKCWLQKYQAVSLLNFVHKFEDFNRRFFGHVEFREEELQSFHKELSNLMDVHFSKGPCCIPISSKIIEDLKAIVFGKQQSHENLIKASRPLTLAYNTTLYLLEEYYLPDFCHGIFFNDSSLACGHAAYEVIGPRDAQHATSKSITRSASNLSNRKTNAKYQNSNPQKQSSEEMNGSQSDAFSFTEYFSKTSDDLQTVRVTIPRVERDAKGEYAFVVAVESSIEALDSQRHYQLRYYPEFYALESKLKEFHGTLGCSLPTRRLILRTEEYHINIRSELESWLQKIITRPELRHSRLLLDFIQNNQSESFGSGLIESSINLNRVTQPLDKLISTKKAPRLLESFANRAKMHSAIPDENYVGPKNAAKVYEEKQASFTYLSESSSLSVSSTSSSLSFQFNSREDNSLACSLFSLFSAHFFPQKFFKSLISSFRHVLILLIKASTPSKPEAIEKETVKQTIDSLLEGICSIGLDTLQASSSNTATVTPPPSRRDQAVAALKWWPLSKSIMKIAEAPLLLKQIYFIIIDDVVSILFPEISK
ncbi:Oidioi.mRNA.OKI2018_I69.chr2.g5591.t1.cds [Oikopleura dioica]|uniref:Oidioi.mRNA.OKI2018_I69.chr2.g5591.t1.cds n=1 Tax=Oikopleura dioica TaxID=34765 RepID=A0ABN7T2I4_OIKDI|nr:Oidioi.mRNA.OKI2018_I69.chr2.g5591.t1.cds [Oikopleura dioica]